ncbi:hypothetical protein C2G38_393208 [Gigaspora rosea]|uniref:Uncharacterized protein n=1 Tax=Gigaspora rosea TaxID=44941 RepID=A0A397UE24_9GLOM|nr:hypothetical protein C2G38_393208 [Gigaspora rosea]
MLYPYCSIVLSAKFYRSFIAFHHYITIPSIISSCLLSGSTYSSIIIFKALNFGIYVQVKIFLTISSIFSPIHHYEFPFFASSTIKMFYRYCGVICSSLCLIQILFSINFDSIIIS